MSEDAVFLKKERKVLMIEARSNIRGKAWLAPICLTIGLYGCGSFPTILSEYEGRLDIADDVSREFHSSLYYPKGLALQYPGYLIGIEKADQEKVMGPSVVFPSFLNSRSDYFRDGEKDVKWGLGSIDLLQKLQEDPKVMFISHITRFNFVHDTHLRSPDATSPPYTHIDSCFLYNAFRSPFFSLPEINDSRISVRKWRDLNGVIAWKDCKDSPSWTGSRPELESKTFYANGIPAIKALAKSVAQDLKDDGYTHILILVMGWNTAQDEAIRNFNDLTGNLLEASRESEAEAAGKNEVVKGDKKGEKHLPFRPLVIGVSWPSYWWKSVMNVFSYPNKATDADKIGITWLNLLVNRELPDAMKIVGVKMPIVLIGHSFGARAVTRVAAASPALSPKIPGEFEGLYSGANLIIGLQGAVSINRFWPVLEGESPGDEGSPLRDFSTLESTRFAFTASSHDSAAGGPVFWFDPTGSINSYRLVCDSQTDDWRKKVFHCLSAHDTSGLNVSLAERKRWEGFKVCEIDDPSICRHVSDKITTGGKKVLYIDASDGITQFNTLGTGGHAHSDIFRLPMGRLLWMLITSLAPLDQ